MGTCKECNGTGAIAVQTRSATYVTREMAIDAEMPDLEGHIYEDNGSPMTLYNMDSLEHHLEKETMNKRFTDLYPNGEGFYPKPGRVWIDGLGRIFVEEPHSKINHVKGCGPVSDFIEVTLDDPMPHGYFAGVKITELTLYIDIP